MPSLRLQRVRELLKREIGEVIRREFQVSEAGLITVNDVDVSGDLHSAVVFVSILGSRGAAETGLRPARTPSQTHPGAGGAGGRLEIHAAAPVPDG